MDWKSVGGWIDEAGFMLDSQWSRQVGYRADELAQIMRTGVAGE